MTKLSGPAQKVIKVRKDWELKRKAGKHWKTLKALLIVRDNEDLTARNFGLLMWENSPARYTVKNTGNGATHGKGLWLCAGSYLHKLQARGLVRESLDRECYTWYVTELGRDKIKEWGAGKGEDKKS